MPNGQPPLTTQVASTDDDADLLAELSELQAQKEEEKVMFSIAGFAPTRGKTQFQAFGYDVHTFELVVGACGLSVLSIILYVCSRCRRRRAHSAHVQRTAPADLSSQKSAVHMHTNPLVRKASALGSRAASFFRSWRGSGSSAQDSGGQASSSKRHSTVPIPDSLADAVVDEIGEDMTPAPLTLQIVHRRGGSGNHSSMDSQLSNASSLALKSASSHASL